jgi:histone-lysine N-methyltransferase SETD1
VYDDHHGFYVAFYGYQDARDCYAAHGDGKSFIDGFRLKMQLIDDKDSIRASKEIGSPPRRKRRQTPPKRTVEDEATDAIIAELKDVFIKDVRSRIVNPMLFDLLDPSHYKDIQSKAGPSIEPIKLLRPEPIAQIKSPLKQERMVDVPLSRLSIANRIPLLPRFRKKGAEPVKEESGKDRKLTKADVRPMHHQFNHYSDSEDEDEDELPQRDVTVASESDLDESSRPSRETTSVSTPEPSKVKFMPKSIVQAKDILLKQEESEEELLKDILLTTKEDTRVRSSKRKRVVDFTSSEDEAEPSPPKKICVEDIPEVVDAMQVEESVTPKLSKAALAKVAKAKAVALRRAKKVETKVKVEDSITIETPVKEIIVPVPTKSKVPDINLSEIEDDDDLLLDLDGVQSLVRDKEDYGYLIQALTDVVAEPMEDIWTWAWKQKKLKAQNLDGTLGISLVIFPTSGPIKKPEPPSYNRVNATGCARTEGYIKIPEAEKSLYLPQRNKAIVPSGSEAARKTSRMNRVNNRRLAADMEVQKKTLSTESDILRFNQLKARKKQLKFARSPIHDWGLFAMEDIEAHEMVIEYVGEIIRFQVAELREKQYERVGIGSSYLFRVDDENIIDGMDCWDRLTLATKTGNIARFINHCCTPNCSAKIIQVQGEKKIVIYADRFIGAGEEITYGTSLQRIF